MITFFIMKTPIKSKEKSEGNAAAVRNNRARKTDDRKAVEKDGQAETQPRESSPKIAKKSSIKAKPKKKGHGSQVKKVCKKKTLALSKDEVENIATNKEQPSTPSIGQHKEPRTADVNPELEIVMTDVSGPRPAKISAKKKRKAEVEPSTISSTRDTRSRKST